jgi:hypothetical protein
VLVSDPGQTISRTRFSRESKDSKKGTSFLLAVVGGLEFLNSHRAPDESYFVIVLEIALQLFVGRFMSATAGSAVHCPDYLGAVSLGFVLLR